MIQRTYTVSQSQELRRILDKLASGISYRDYQGRLVILSAIGMDPAMVSDFCRMIREEIPGIVTAGLYQLPEENYDGEPLLRLSFLFFHSSQVHLLEYEQTTPAADRQNRLDFAQKCQEMKDIRAAVLMTSGLSVKVSELTEFITGILPGIPVFGQAMTAEPFLDVSLPFVYGSRPMVNGVIIVLLSGSSLRVSGQVISGWQPVGKQMIPELRQGDEFLQAGDTLVKEIDGYPAFDIYRHYLKVKRNHHFQENIYEFPLVLNRDGEDFYRVPIRYDEAGELCFMGDIRPGETLRFSYGMPDVMLQETDLHARKIAGLKPEAVLLFAADPRLRLMRQYPENEITLIQHYHPELQYMHGLCEIFRQDQVGGVTNASDILITMTEERPETNQPGADQSAANRPADTFLLDEDDAVLPMRDRLSAFLGAISSDLEKAAREAEAASRAKSAFLSAMSHEIRTPINAVLGMDEMILRETHEENSRCYAENIRSAGDSLLSLVNDVLDYSRMEAGKVTIIPAEYQTARLISSLDNLIRTRAEGKGLKLEIQADEQIPRILRGDEIRIRQILTNLLTNAVKYTEKGSVTMKVAVKSASGDRVTLHFSVEDTGIGIRKEDMPRLFEAFSRLEENRNRGIEGTGLGMGIITHLLDLMGSKLEVESTYGAGSVFSFDLVQDVTDPSPMGNYEEAFHSSMSGSQSYQVSFIAPDAHILAVDDTPVNLTVLCQLLKQTRVQIDCAESGKEALAKATAHPYDLIYLDYRMPEMGGEETLDALRREQPEYLHVPVICLSADSASGTGEKYLRQGFTDFLSKPVDPAALEAMTLKYLPADKVKKPDAANTAQQPGSAAGMMQQADAGAGNENRMVSAAGNKPLAEISSTEDSQMAVYEHIPGLDTASGIRTCGSPEGYLAVLKQFAAGLSKMRGEIEGYYQKEDWKDYTIKVHALKSSARIAGALELSDRAKALENAGDRQDFDYIHANHRDMILMIQKLSEEFSDAEAGSGQSLSADGQSPSAGDQPEESLPLITDDEFLDAMDALTDMAMACDYEGTQQILEMLGQYQIPSDRQALVHEIRQAAEKPDWTALGSLLKSAAENN